VIEAASVTFGLPASEAIDRSFPRLETDEEIADELEALWERLMDLQQEVNDELLSRKICYAAGALGNACKQASGD